MILLYVRRSVDKSVALIKHSVRLLHAFYPKTSITKCAFWFKHCVNIYFSLVEYAAFTPLGSIPRNSIAYISVSYILCTLYTTQTNTNAINSFEDYLIMCFRARPLLGVKCDTYEVRRPGKLIVSIIACCRVNTILLSFKNFSNTLEICLGRNHRWNMKKLSVYIQNIYCDWDIIENCSTW